MTAQVVVGRAGTGPINPLAGDRGTFQGMVGPHRGVHDLDVHENVLTAGCGLGAYHRHDRSSNVYIVLEGVVTLMTEGELHELHVGDYAYVAAGVPHAAGNLSSAVARVLEVYTPASPDFTIVEDPPSQGHGPRGG